MINNNSNLNQPNDKINLVLELSKGDDAASLLSNENVEFLNMLSNLNEEQRNNFLTRDDEVGERFRFILDDVEKRVGINKVIQETEKLSEEELSQGFQANLAKRLKTAGEFYTTSAQEFDETLAGEALGVFNIPSYLAAISGAGFTGAGNLLDPTGERRRYQNFGIDPYEGLSIGPRTRLSFGASRNYTPDDVETVIEKAYGQKPFFAGNIIAGDKNSPIVFQMNEGDLPKAVNAPGITTEDLASFAVQDAVPLAPEIAFSIYARNKFFDKGYFTTTKREKLKQFGGTQVAPATVVNGMYELLRLIYGKEFMGLNKDKTIVDFAQDSGMIALLAGGGEAAMGSFVTGMSALYKNLYKEGSVPDKVVNDLKEIVDRARLKISRGEVIEEAPPNFKPTFGQQVKDPDLLYLESVFLGSDAVNKEIRSKYLEGLQDNNRAIVDYIKNLVSVEGNTLSSAEILEKIAPSIQNFSRERARTLIKTVDDELAQELNNARKIRAKYDTSRGNAFEVGNTLFGRETVDPTQAKIPGTFDFRVNELNQQFRDEVNDIYDNVLNPARRGISTTPTNFRETLIRLDNANKDKSINAILPSLNNTNIRRELGLEGDSFVDTLNTLANRYPKGTKIVDADGNTINVGGQFVGSAEGINVGQLLDLKEGLDKLIKSTDDRSVKKQLLNLAEALQKDIDGSLAKGKFQEPININGILFDNPAKASLYVDNLYQQANENIRSGLLQDFRSGKFDYASFFDYVSKQSGKNYESMAILDDVFNILGKNDVDYIPAFKNAFYERLRNAVSNVDSKALANKVVREFMDNNSGIANKIFTQKEIKSLKANWINSLSKEAAARESADSARAKINNEFSPFMNEDVASVGNVVDNLLLKNPEKLTTKQTRELIKIIKDNPTLEKEVQHYLLKDLQEKITIKDNFYGDTFNAEKIINLVEDPNFKKVYKEFLGTDYVMNLNKVKSFITMQQRALGNKFSSPGGGVDLNIDTKKAEDIVNFYGSDYSVGQKLAQFFLGPLNKYSVKFRLSSGYRHKKGYETVSKILSNPELFDEFIKNRYKRLNNIKDASILGGFISKQVFAEEPPESLPINYEEIKLLPQDYLK